MGNIIIGKMKKGKSEWNLCSVVVVFILEYRGVKANGKSFFFLFYV